MDIKLLFKRICIKILKLYFIKYLKYLLINSIKSILLFFYILL